MTDIFDFIEAARSKPVPPNTPPKEWVGPPITPMPAGTTPLLAWARADPSPSRGEAVICELIELHRPQPDYVHVDGTCTWVCHGCDANGYDAEYVDWPCETTRVIARHLGVDL